MRFPQQHPNFILWKELLLGQWSIRHDFTERDAVDVPNVEHVETQYAKYIDCKGEDLRSGLEFRRRERGVRLKRYCLVFARGKYPYTQLTAVRGPSAGCQSGCITWPDPALAPESWLFRTAGLESEVCP